MATDTMAVSRAPTRTPAVEGRRSTMFEVSAGERRRDHGPRSVAHRTFGHPERRSPARVQPGPNGILRVMSERLVLTSDRVIDTERGEGVADRAVIVEGDRIVDV